AYWRRRRTRSSRGTVDREYEHGRAGRPARAAEGPLPSAPFAGVDAHHARNDRAVDGVDERPRAERADRSDSQGLRRVSGRLEPCALRTQRRARRIHARCGVRQRRRRAAETARGQPLAGADGRLADKTSHRNRLVAMIPIRELLYAVRDTIDQW